MNAMAKTSRFAGLVQPESTARDMILMIPQLGQEDISDKTR
jgi:hypothetical protein